MIIPKLMIFPLWKQVYESYRPLKTNSPCRFEKNCVDSRTFHHNQLTKVMDIPNVMDVQPIGNQHIYHEPSNQPRGLLQPKKLASQKVRSPLRSRHLHHLHHRRLPNVTPDRRKGGKGCLLQLLKAAWQV